tara:strand:- start:3070 stop:3753 length:684 start_codon:yes stop_codon:yes gene_type:complete
LVLHTAFTLPQYALRNAVMRALIATFFAAFLLLPSNTAAALQAVPLNAEQHAQLKRVSDYLDEINTLQSGFLQISSTGETANGTILLSRPKHLRIEYDPPTPILIIANGEYLSYIDTELQQVNHIPVDDTPAAFLLRDDFSFTGKDLTVTDFQRAANTIRISIVKTSDPLAGELTLVVSENPMQLRKWSIVDAQGITTDVTLLNPRFGEPIADDQFNANFLKFDLTR